MKQSKIDVQVKSNFTGAQVMGVDSGAMGHILSILSNMYSDGSLAVVREYASNALDSHIEAGNPDPIIVTSPSHFNPVLTVQDFGTGLSKDEMLNVYAVYGASTKRDTDDQIGSFGIGAKSAFTVGTQFIVTAVKDGMMSMVLFALDEDGAPTVNVIGHEQTDEPNGVKVEIGVRDVDGVVRAIERLFATWPKGTVMVDGVEPVSIWDEAERLEDDIHIARKGDGAAVDQRRGSWTIVMGGVPYPVPDAVTVALDYRNRNIVQSMQASRYAAYLTVPIGGVDITPSREELRATPKTIATINVMVARFHMALGPYVTSKIASAPSMLSAVIAHSELQTDLGSMAPSGVTWRGKPIPSNRLATTYPWFKLGYRRGRFTKVARRNGDYDLVPNAQLHNVLFVTDVPDNRVRTVQLAATEYLNGQDDGSLDKVTRVVAVTQSAQTPGDWFDINDVAIRKMTFDQFKSFKPAPAPRQGGHSEVSYKISTGGYRTSSDLKSEPVLYYMTHYEYPNYKVNGDLVKNALNGAPLIILKSTQKVEPLLKRLPQVAHAPAKIAQYADSVLASVTQDDIDAMTAHQFQNKVSGPIVRLLEGNRSKITHAGVIAVMDDYLRAVTLTGDAARMNRASLITYAARQRGKFTSDLGKSSWYSGTWDRLMNTLPLLTSYFEREWGRTPEGDAHVIAYINMIGNQAI